jgi:hypothetical protein
MIGYYEHDRYYTYSNNNVTTSTTTCFNTVSISTSTAWVSNYVEVYDHPIRRPKPPYVPFEPVRLPRYQAPPMPCPWPVALRRFRGDLM